MIGEYGCNLQITYKERPPVLIGTHRFYPLCLSASLMDLAGEKQFPGAFSYVQGDIAGNILHESGVITVIVGKHYGVIRLVDTQIFPFPAFS